MSSNDQQSSLNRRPSIHTRANLNSNRISRQFSTLEIEVEYISTNHSQPPPPPPQQQTSLTESHSRNSLHGRDSSHPDLNRDGTLLALNKVIEEEEEEEEGEEEEEVNTTTTDISDDNHTETSAGVGVGSFSPYPRLPSRQFPATMTRQQRIFRTPSQLFYAQPWQPHQYPDQLARHDSGSQRSTPSTTSSSRYASGGSGRFVGGHSVHSSVSHSEYIQSSQILHDETPALSSSGSQTDEDDDEEVHSPVECLDVLDDDEVHSPVECLDVLDDDEVHSPVECLDVLDDNGEEGVEEESRAHTGKQGEGESGHKPIPSRIDHHPAEIETETPEVLKRERTRILERTVVNSYRQIDFADITNVQRLKRGGYGEIHTAEWSRLSVVLKRSLPDDSSKGAEEFEHEVRTPALSFMISLLLLSRK
ncbi:MAG: hypothetical protein J3R72DRAFT_122794 [Linnemannia gamsii]|nr:MAG: hypothetical protein J3R72DRAFT_122794 [Linnemannia gamsii]